jgi:galactokinase
VMVSSVPLGGGLSSSAALEVATATLLEVVGDVRLDPLDKARLCQKAEHDYAGVPCGIMDQMISVLADPNGALLIDCRSESTQIVPMADSTFGFLIANTNVRHSLASGEYALRRNQCREAARKLGLTSLRDATLTLLDTHFGELSGAEGRRARHVITENERTLRAADALRRADLTTLGVLMSDSHRSLRHDFEVSCPELDVLVDAALAMGQGEGVFGARMTGGGFGGCTLTLIRNECASAVYARLDSEYRRIVGRPLDGFVSRPARGAHRLAPTSIAD